MPLGTLERKAPPLFRQGPSALSRLLFFCALSVLMMVGDARFHITGPLRSMVATALYPLQWLAMQPVHLFESVRAHYVTLDDAKKTEETARQQLAQLTLRASQSEDLLRENNRLRALLELRTRVMPDAKAAQALYEAADAYTRKIVIDRGARHGVVPGSPVMDETGVLGQLTSVQPLTSEVTLLVDRNQAIPVMNTRTMQRGVVYGEPASAWGEGLALRFVLADADVQEGDILSTSGVDGVYPPGLAVARVTHIQRNTDSAFARIFCEPLAQMQQVRHVMVLAPLEDNIVEPVRLQDLKPPAAADGGAKPGSGAEQRPAADVPAL